MFVGFVFICTLSTIGPCTRANAQQVIQIPGSGFSNTKSMGLAGPPCILAVMHYAHTFKLTAGMKFGIGCELQEIK